MPKFNEYIPNGGWIKENKRRALKRCLCRLFAYSIACALLVASYAFVGFVERGF